MSVRYGIIGTGMMGCEHIRNLVQIADADVIAVADPIEKSRRWAQKACGDRFTPVAYEHYQDLLTRPDIDAIVVASPNFTHIDVMRDVFETDKHVLLEKPMCTTLADCKEVVRRSESHPGIVWVGMEYRYMAPVARLVQDIEAGAVGQLKMFFVREHRHPFLKKVGDWNRFKRNSGGTLVEKCCHFFDMMNLVIKATPMSVFASGGQDVNHLDEHYNGETPDILDNAYVIVNYDSGARACLDLCMFADGSRNEQELVAIGDRGKLETSIPDNTFTRSGRTYRQFETFTLEPDPRVREVGFHYGASYLEHLNFIDAIRQNGSPAVSTAQGLMSVAMGVAGQLSIEQGRLVTIEEVLLQP